MEIEDEEEEEEEEEEEDVDDEYVTKLVSMEST